MNARISRRNFVSRTLAYGGAATPLILASGKAFACHEYVSPIDGKTGCGAYQRDLDAGSSGGNTTPSPEPAPGGGTTDTLGRESAFGGRFYGNPYMCDTVSEIRYYRGAPVAKRIIAEHTGDLEAIRWHNRPGSGYSSGDGGQVVIKIESDRNGKPSGEVLAETAVNGGGSAPTNQGFFPRWSFKKPVRLTLGQPYHIVWYQIGSSGYIPVNFHYAYSPIPYGQMSGGPYEGDDWPIHRLNNSGWYRVAEHGGFIQLYHKDGVTTGCPVIFSSYGFHKAYGGNTQIRQRFTMDSAGRTVDGLWFRTWYQSGTPADLKVQVRESGGSMLAELRVAPREMAKTPNRLDYPDQPGNPPATWIYKKFDGNLTLKPNKAYEVRMSADYGTYLMHATQLGDPQSRGATSRNAWSSGIAEFSTNGGSSWKGWDDTKEKPGVPRNDVLLPMAFTVVALKEEPAVCT